MNDGGLSAIFLQTDAEMLHWFKLHDSCVHHCSFILF